MGCAPCECLHSHGQNPSPHPHPVKQVFVIALRNQKTFHPQMTQIYAD
jgi:hypothetical protein